MPPVWFLGMAAALVGGSFWYGRHHGQGIADGQGSAYDSGATAASLLDYGISPSGDSALVGYGGSFVVNPSLASGGTNTYVGGSTPTEVQTNITPSTSPPTRPPQFIPPPVDRG